VLELYNTSGEKFKEAGNLLRKSLGREEAYNTPKPHQGGTNMKNHLSLYQMVLKSLTFYFGVDQEKKKAGRPPKVSDLQFSG
jgi:hypothetical protein